MITTLDWRAETLAEKWLAAAAIAPNLKSAKSAALLQEPEDRRRRPGRGSTPCAARTSTTARSSRSTTGPATSSPTPAARATTRTSWRAAKFEPKYDAAGDGARQPGSAFKPIVYASAFDTRKLTPGSLLLDIATAFGQGLDAARRRPARSRAGPRPEGAPVLAQHARRSGRSSGSATRPSPIGRRSSGSGSPAARKAFLQAGLAGAIGTVEVRPLDLTSAYGALANGGVHVPTRMILEVRDAAGKVDLRRRRSRRASQAVSPQAAYLVTDILQGNTDPKPEPDLVGGARDPQRAAWPAPAGRGQDRHGQRRPRPRDVRLPRPAEGSEGAGDRGRALDGQQRPLEPALARSPRPR